MQTPITSDKVGEIKALVNLRDKRIKKTKITNSPNRAGDIKDTKANKAIIASSELSPRAIIILGSHVPRSAGSTIIIIRVRIVFPQDILLGSSSPLSGKHPGNIFSEAHPPLFVLLTGQTMRNNPIIDNVIIAAQ